MRPIDADALDYALGASDEDIYFHHMLEDAPTIDAIPVEWLKGLMLSTDDDVDKVEFAWIMREWQEEQGAKT